MQVLNWAKYNMYIFLTILKLPMLSVIKFNYYLINVILLKCLALN